MGAASGCATMKENALTLKKSGSAAKPPPQALVLGDDVRSLLAVIRSLGRGGVRVHVAGHPVNSPARKSRYAFKQHDLPPYVNHEEAWCYSLASLMQQEQFELVMPCSDPFQIPLQRHRALLECHGPIYLLNDRVFYTVSDKLMMNQLARAAGVPVPREVVVSSTADVPGVRESFRLPVVLKPQSSYNLAQMGARRSVKKAFTWQEFDTAIAEMLQEGEVAVQENFCGRGVGVEFLLDQGQPLLEFQHVRVHEPLHGGGSYYRRGVEVDPSLRDAALRLLAPLDYSGVVMVEFKRNDQTGKWMFIEVNGRFWGSLPLAVASGVDFPLALYKLWVDKQTPSPRAYRVGLSCRYWSGDIRWQIANLRADRSDPLLATSPLSRVVTETLVNVCTLRERSDTFSLDDPLPAAAELSQLATDLGASVLQKWRKAWIGGPLSKRHMRSRALRAFQQAQAVAFICKGNICRSPFAERLAQQLFAGEKEFTSAGYYPQAGRECPAEAITAGMLMNVDLSLHRSQRLTAERLQEVDVAFVFDYENYLRVRTEFRQARQKVFPIGILAAEQPLWIEDPFGNDLEFFRHTYEQIKTTLLAVCQSEDAAATIPFQQKLARICPNGDGP
jgi:predicted ATP-grasp superfamily ATP-dependent carboligase/protein-tyrosine-phosphatase